MKEKRRFTVTFEINADAEPSPELLLRKLLKYAWRACKMRNVGTSESPSTTQEVHHANRPTTTETGKERLPALADAMLNARQGPSDAPQAAPTIEEEE